MGHVQGEVDHVDVHLAAGGVVGGGEAAVPDDDEAAREVERVRQGGRGGGAGSDGTGRYTDDRLEGDCLELIIAILDHAMKSGNHYDSRSWTSNRQRSRQRVYSEWCGARCAGS